MELYAIDKIKKVVVQENEIISETFTYLPETKRKFLGLFEFKNWIKRESGFYIFNLYVFSGSHWVFLGKEFNEPNYVLRQENGQNLIYQKRWVQLFFDGTSETIYFDNSIELSKFVEEIRETYLRIFKANLIESKS